ncbi:MAG: hypothetical protein JJU30_01325 [Alkalimonas sp.]|nr:hypothetical protein [Alkalimonas sp.]
MWASLQQAFQKQPVQRAVAALHWQPDKCRALVLTNEKGTVECTFQTTVPVSENFTSVVQQLVAQMPAAQDVVLVLSPEYYQLVQVDKPQIPEAELKAALRWQLKELVSIEPDDMQLDYMDLPNAHQQQAPRIQAIACSKRFLQQLMAVLHRAKLPVSSIVPEEWSLRSLLPPQAPSTLILSHRAGQELAMMIVRGSQVCFSRRIRGLAQLEQLSLDVLQQGYLDTLGLEVQRSVDYFEGQLKQAPVKQLLLALDTELQDEIASFFRQLGFAQVETLDLNTWLTDSNRTEQAEFAIPLAAAMEQLSATQQQEAGVEN